MGRGRVRGREGNNGERTGEREIMGRGRVRGREGNNGERTGERERGK